MNSMTTEKVEVDLGLEETGESDAQRKTNDASEPSGIYNYAKEYWSTVTPTVDGMLGGFGKVSPTDINGSRAFLRPFMKISGGTVAPSLALDCGAGIGRITKRLLLPIFETVDMVEQDQQFVSQARTFIGPESSRVRDLHCCGLQEFTPPEKTYNLIWCQWVLGHLEDDDLVTFFQRCRRGLAEGGIIVVKENTSEGEEKVFDETDHSYTRSRGALRFCILKAGLEILKEQKQKDFPKDLYPVYMFAMR